MDCLVALLDEYANPLEMLKEYRWSELYLEATRDSINEQPLRSIHVPILTSAELHSVHLALRANRHPHRGKDQG